MSNNSWIVLGIVVVALFCLYEFVQWIRKKLSEFKASEDSRRQASTYIDERLRESAVSRTIQKAAESQQPVPVRQPPPPPPTEAELRVELAEATDVDECLRIYNDAPNGHPIEAEAKAKIVSLFTAQLAEAKTAENCWQVRNDIVDDVDIDWPETDEVVKKAVEKSLALVTTFDEAQTHFIDLEDGSNDDEFVDLKKAFAKKAVQLGTFDEVYNFLDDMCRYDSDYGAEYDIAVERLVDIATTSSEFDDLFENVELGKLEKAAAAKYVALLETVDECHDVWQEQDLDSALGEAAICRAADLIRAKGQAEFTS